MGSPIKAGTVSFDITGDLAQFRASLNEAIGIAKQQKPIELQMRAAGEALQTPTQLRIPTARPIVSGAMPGGAGVVPPTQPPPAIAAGGMGDFAQSLGLQGIASKIAGSIAAVLGVNQMVRLGSESMKLADDLSKEQQRLSTTAGQVGISYSDASKTVQQMYAELNKLTEVTETQVTSMVATGMQTRMFGDTLSETMKAAAGISIKSGAQIQDVFGELARMRVGLPGDMSKFLPELAQQFPWSQAEAARRIGLSLVPAAEKAKQLPSEQIESAEKYLKTVQAHAGGKLQNLAAGSIRFAAMAANVFNTVAPILDYELEDLKRSSRDDATRSKFEPAALNRLFALSAASAALRAPSAAINWMMTPDKQQQTDVLEAMSESVTSGTRRMGMSPEAMRYQPVKPILGLDNGEGGARPVVDAIKSMSSELRGAIERGPIKGAPRVTPSGEIW